MSITSKRIQEYLQVLTNLQARSTFLDQVEQDLRECGGDVKQGYGVDFTVYCDLPEDRAELIRKLAQKGYHYQFQPTVYDLSSVSYHMKKEDNTFTFMSLCSGVRCERVQIGEELQPVYEKRCTIMSSEELEEMKKEEELSI